MSVNFWLYISKCWWCSCVCLLGCSGMSIERAGVGWRGGALLFSELSWNCWQCCRCWLPAASCRGSSQLIAAAAVARRRRRKVAVFLLAGRDNLSGSSAGWGLLTTVIQDCVCAGAMPHGCGHIYYNGNYWHYNYPPANSELPNNSQLCHCCISALCST